MSRRHFPWLLVPAIAALLLRAQAPPPPNSYVDSHVCATCHPQIAATYARTGMARSFYRPDPAHLQEDLSRGNPFHHLPSDTWYAMERRSGELYQRRWRVDPAGRQIEAQESRVDFVMGSGNHVRTYLHRNARGALIELSLAWYAENGGLWALEPGHDRDYVLPTRQIAYECMFCHNAYPRIPANHDEPGAEPVYEGALPQGIDCQRCHGPGGNHVRAAQQGAAGDTIKSAIVNPARLSADRQMEVCLQCHLETIAEPIPRSILKFGRAPFSYRPGEPLGNFEIFFDRAPTADHQDDFEIAHSAYRLRKSQCFLKSAGKLTCTTCHNPHDVPRGPVAAQHYNAVCGQCHTATLRPEIAAGKHSAAGDCIACHMPKRRTEDVIHAVMTDHLIQRRPPARDLLAALAERPDSDANHYHGEVVPYYPAPLPHTPENSLYEAVAQVTDKSNLTAGLPRLAAEIARQKPPQAEFYVELGQAWMAAGKPANAVAPFEEAARRKPTSAVVALNLADALTDTRQSLRAIALLETTIRRAPTDALLWYQLGIAQANSGQDAASIDSWRKCINLDPDMPEPHNLLGAALAGTGDLEGAAREFLAALALYPDFPEALGDYGHLLAARHELGDAVFYLARSVKLKPGDAEVLTNYAVVLASLNRFAEARQQIEAALAADPQSADAHNFRGTLLDREGLRQEALSEFRQAVRLRPDFALAHLNAGKVLVAQGDLPAAQQQLQLAAAGGNPEVAQEAEALLRQMGKR